jgi:transposase-like protein
MSTDYHRHKRYDDEFRRNALDLLESSRRPIAEIAEQLGIPYKTLEGWKYRMRGCNRKPSSAKPADPLALENEQLRRKLAKTELERDILKKALAICSRETKDSGGSN